MSTDASCLTIQNLSFAYNKQANVLHDISLRLQHSHCVLLCGRNGSGKSTLMRIIAGRHMLSIIDSVLVNGKPSFDAGCNTDIVYLDSQWAVQNIAFSGYAVGHSVQISVREVAGRRLLDHPKRAETLRRVLAIDLDWNVPMLSEGQRRRVQIFVNLIIPYRVLLLDEVTSALDALYREDLLLFLKEEAKSRKCLIVYATHILDGLDGWADEVVFLNSRGQLAQHVQERNICGNIRDVILQWMRADHHDNSSLEKESSLTAMLRSSSEANKQNGAGGFASGRLIRTLDSQ